MSLHILEFYMCGAIIRISSNLLLLPWRYSRCVKDIRRKWVKFCFDVPNVWPVQREANLIPCEIMMLGKTSLQFQQRHHMAHEHLFGNNEIVAAQIRNTFELIDPQVYLLYRNDRPTPYNLNRGIFITQLSRWDSFVFVDAELSVLFLAFKLEWSLIWSPCTG